MAIKIGFVRKEDVTVTIKLLDSSRTDQEVVDGLTTGLYEMCETTREIYDTSTGFVIGNMVEWEPGDLTHGNFELLED